MEQHAGPIARPAFLFRAPLRVAGEAPPFSNLPTLPRWLLLAPEYSSLHFTLYAIEPSSLAESLLAGAIPLTDLIDSLVGRGLTRAEFEERWAQAVRCPPLDRVTRGVFFALRDSKRFPLRVLENTPLVYLNERGRRILIEAPQEVTLFDIGYRLSREAYIALRADVARMPIPLAATARDEPRPEGRQSARSSEHPGNSPPTSAPQIARRNALHPGSAKRPVGRPGGRLTPGRPPATRPVVMRGGVLRSPGEQPRGRFTKGRPISQPPYDPPVLRTGSGLPNGVGPRPRNGYTIRLETNEYEGIDEYVVRNSSGVILGRFATRAEADRFVD